MSFQSAKRFHRPTRIVDFPESERYRIESRAPQDDLGIQLHRKYDMELDCL